MFTDLYNHLAEEEEHSAVNSFLQDLMEQEVLDSGMMEELALDVGQMRKKFRDPVVTMEARHQQVCDQNESQILQDVNTFDWKTVTVSSVEAINWNDDHQGCVLSITLIDLLIATEGA